MDVFIFQADIYCSYCGTSRRNDLASKGKAPEDIANESSYDSDDFPKGPYPYGGGEADTPQHCGDCGVFLENPLTTDGVEYVKNQIDLIADIADGPIAGDLSWSEFADLADGAGKPVLAEWIRFYLAPGM